MDYNTPTIYCMCIDGEARVLYILMRMITNRVQVIGQQ